MTLAVSSTIKFTAISPLTTALIRARTALQQREGRLKVGRTVFTWFGSPEELDTVLDHLVTQEIPGSGASSKEVKRLRELRRFLRAARGIDPNPNEDDAAHVTITSAAGTDVDRDRVVELITQIAWRIESGDDAYDDSVDALAPYGTVDVIEEAIR